MAVILALGAAFLFALGTVLQQKVAAGESDEESLKAGFLLRLVQRPLWLFGIAVDGAGFALQAWALGVGRLVVVQPLLATTVVFALPLGWKITNQHVGRREILGALAVVAGLAAFLVIADPSGGKDDATVRAWIVGGGAAVGACAVLCLAGARRRPGLKAALFGTASGILFGLSAALTKATVELLQDDGILAVFTDWHVYALVLSGVAGASLTQTALQTGSLAPAIATSMSFDAASSLVFGIVLFDETIHESAFGLTASILALLLTCGGLVALASARGAPPASGGLPEPAPAPAV